MTCRGTHDTSSTTCVSQLFEHQLLQRLVDIEDTLHLQHVTVHKEETATTPSQRFNPSAFHIRTYVRNDSSVLRGSAATLRDAISSQAT